VRILTFLDMTNNDARLYREVIAFHHGKIHWLARSRHDASDEAIAAADNKIAWHKARIAECTQRLAEAGLPVSEPVRP
jgi:hypothetical protein